MCKNCRPNSEVKLQWNKENLWKLRKSILGKQVKFYITEIDVCGAVKWLPHLLVTQEMKGNL